MQQITLLTCQEWDELVKETYHKPYCFQQQYGCQGRGIYHLAVPGDARDFENTSIPEIVNDRKIGVSFAAWSARDVAKPLANTRYPGRVDKLELELWWDRSFYPDIQMVANDLYAKGLLASGEYIIEIDW